MCMCMCAYVHSKQKLCGSAIFAIQKYIPVANVTYNNYMLHGSIKVTNIKINKYFALTTFCNMLSYQQL